jgi:putative FmdB family regulatory protein
MPVYEYECNKCGEKFSMLRRFWDKDDEVKCPKCGQKKPKRLISNFSTSGGCDTGSGSSVG